MDVFDFSDPFFTDPFQEVVPPQSSFFGESGFDINIPEPVSPIPESFLGSNFDQWTNWANSFNENLSAIKELFTSNLPTKIPELPKVEPPEIKWTDQQQLDWLQASKEFERQITLPPDKRNSTLYESMRNSFGPTGTGTGTSTGKSTKIKGNDTQALYGQKREGWLMWTEKRGQDNGISMFPNPTSYTLTLPFRGKTEKVRGGTTVSWWHNPLLNTYFDNGTFQMEMQTGSYSPIYGELNHSGKGEKSKGVPRGLWTLYKIMDMMNEDKLIDDNGKINYVYLQYSTYAFPSILIEGVFSPEESFSFTESSDNPLGSINYTVTILINRVQPSFWDLDKLVQRYTENKDALLYVQK